MSDHQKHRATACPICLGADQVTFEGSPAQLAQNAQLELTAALQHVDTAFAITHAIVPPDFARRVRFIALARTLRAVQKALQGLVGESAAHREFTVRTSRTEVQR